MGTHTSDTCRDGDVTAPATITATNAGSSSKIVVTAISRQASLCGTPQKTAYYASPFYGISCCILCGMMSYSSGKAINYLN